MRSGLLDPFRQEGVDAAYTIDHFDLEVITRSPSFTVDSVTTVNKKGRILYKATFSYTPKEERVTELRGWLVVDPEHSWVLEEYDAVRKNSSQKSKPVQLVGLREYDFTGKDPIPRNVEQIAMAIGQSASTRWITSFKPTTWEFEDTQASEFELAHYGLGDLADAGSSTTRNTGAAERSRTVGQAWLWPAGIGIVSLVLAFVVRRLTWRQDQ